MEEKNCEESAQKEELPQKRKLTEKQRKALEEGREKRKQANAERRKQDNKLVDLQAKYEQAREENLRIREEIIQSKLEKITHETEALASKAVKTSQVETVDESSPEKPVVPNKQEPDRGWYTPVPIPQQEQIIRPGFPRSQLNPNPITVKAVKVDTVHWSFV